jgi:hypothetical protein
MSPPIPSPPPIGFHGDLYLIDAVAAAAQRCGQFIETGTHVGYTIAYFAQRFPAIRASHSRMLSVPPTNELPG